jgi:hypothetical protein
MTTRLLVWCGAALWCLSAATQALQAQVDPRGNMRTVTTAHLRVHVRAGQEDLGARVAAIGEHAWHQLAGELVAPRGPIDILVADNTDVSNGFAQSFPTNRVVIYAVPPIGSTELRFHDDWLRLVVTHELAHIFHLDRARGVWRVGRWVFGRNSTLFPTALTPAWVKEGLAVYYESMLTGSGRLVSTESRTVARAAARDDVLPAPGRWSRTTSQFPQGQTVYAYGALLMDRSARTGGDSSMRRFVESTAQFPIPFLLNRASDAAFGTSFRAQFATLRDSLLTLVHGMDTSGDGRWTTVSDAGWYAESPRWMSNDSLLWVANNGRDITGVYVAGVPARGETPHASRRVARRNSLDVNVPLGGGRVVFAQLDYRNPYELRSDLYRGTGTGSGERETRLTHGARLTQPDVRRDGSIVAIELAAARTYMVRMQPNGGVTRLTANNTWAEPRWSPDGTRIVAVEFLPSGDERVVVLDTLGRVQSIVSGGRAVFASPSFTPDGKRLVWSSDRSGAMQLETAPVPEVADTVRWREPPTNVRVASAVTTGVYQPSVSPDGQRVAALRYRGDGFDVAVASLDTTGPLARNTWYEGPNAFAGRANSVDAHVAEGEVVDTAAMPIAAYNPVRQLLPRYWLPQVGTGRNGQSTLGASTGSSDILGRHVWSAQLLTDIDNGETDVSAAYRYRGLGVPVLDVSWSQSWDATFRVVDSTNAVLGTVARQRRFTTVSGTWLVPRTRRSLSATVGAQYEMRNFTSTVDSLLGDATSVLRRGTRYPSAFVNTSLSTARLGARGISVEEGVSVATSSSYRWREDMPSLGSWRHVVNSRGYVPLNLPGFARHVLMARVAAGVADNNTASEFSVGGVSGERVELLPGVLIGDVSRTFAVRGVAPGVQRGTRAVGGSIEYRAPLVLFQHAPSPLTVFLNRMSITAFSDAGRAWCPNALVARKSVLCEPAGTRDGWIASAGAEIVVDLAVQYDTPYRLRFGGAVPYVAPAGVARRGAMYVTLGSYF